MRIKRIIGTIAGAAALGLVIATGAPSVSAQNTSEEYREWQRARREAQEERRDYTRSRSRSDYRDWQEARREANEEYREYQRSRRGGVYYRGADGRLYDRRWDNNGRNNRYDNPYANRRYRVYRNGSYYNTDHRGAELLRSAVNQGYNQGYRQGQLDARYGRRYNYSGGTVYRSGSYGYQSYVARNQYQYYFQQGFQRGYEDGFHNTSRYGYRSNNGFNILTNVLGSILNLTEF